MFALFPLATPVLDYSYPPK